MDKNKIVILTATAFLFLVGNGVVCAAEQDTKAGKIHVDYEWDRLEEVILGSPKNLTVPGDCPTIKFGFDYQKGNEQWIKKYGGQKMEEVDPDFYKKIVNQSNNLAKLLESCGVKVHRHDPGLLTPEELVFMSDLEKGYNFLYPRDPVIVIGNHVIEAALKLPMRTREKFIVRKIFEKILKDNPDVQYVSVPSVSPSFPTKGGIYLEGGDVMLNGKEIYVGHSGNASSEAGIEWLRRYLGDDYTVHQIDIRGFQHLDCVLSLVRPGLAIRCPDAFVGDLPDSLKDWDYINVPLVDDSR
ncbi:MAG: amidinotransferase [Deltaproteobacteria bacterium]|nr:amidinotransferase [Deltaproteobacteria bacterium]